MTTSVPPIELDRTALACPVCGQAHRDEAVPEGSVASCARCGATLARRPVDSLQRTAALSIAALVLYVPANLFPILRMKQYGATVDNTVWEGSVNLFKDGDLFVATIVFLASILLPLLKLLGLLMLCATATLRSRRLSRPRTLVLRAIEGLGRWAMLDVFVLAVLVSLVKLQGFATVLAGPGLFAFTGVVVLTLLASASFDPHLLWPKKATRP